MQNITAPIQSRQRAAAEPRQPGSSKSGRGKYLGVMPKVTGFDAVIWLHKAQNDRQPFVVATPGADYTDTTRAVFCVEPMLIQVSPELKDFDVKHAVAAFVEENLSTILAFWEGDLSDPVQVISLIKKASGGR